MSKFINLAKYIDGTGETKIVYVASDAIRSIEAAESDGETESMDSLLTFKDGSTMRVWESRDAIIEEIAGTDEI